MSCCNLSFLPVHGGVGWEKKGGVILQIISLLTAVVNLLVALVNLFGAIRKDKEKR